MVTKLTPEHSVVAGDLLHVAGVYDVVALYADEAELAVDPTSSIQGRDAIGSFWRDDFGTSKPSTTSNLTDVYVAGDLAHLEGEYEVTEKGKVTKGISVHPRRLAPMFE